MLETKLLRNEKDKANWVAERRKHNRDFESDIPNLPVWVVWTDTESNGIEDTQTFEFSQSELKEMLKQIKQQKREALRDQWTELDAGR